MKKTVLFIFAFIVSSSAIAQDFHFVYIRLDNDMDYSIVNEKLTELTTNINTQNEDFILLFSNSYPKKICKKTQEISEIKKEILNTIPNTGVDVNDELNTLLEIFAENEVCKIETNTLDEKLFVKPNEKYKAISFHCFVGNSFFDSGYQNSLLAKFLFASDLQSRDFNVDIYYYNSSSLDENNTRFNKIYVNNNLKIHIK